MHPISDEQYKLYYPLYQDYTYTDIDEDEYPPVFLASYTEMLKQKHPYHEHAVNDKGIWHCRMIDEAF